MDEKNLTNGMMRGKRGIVMGVANDRSIAWGIADALAKQGAELAFTYQNERLKKNVEKIVIVFRGLGYQDLPYDRWKETTETLQQTGLTCAWYSFY